MSDTRCADLPRLIHKTAGATPRRRRLAIFALICCGLFGLNATVWAQPPRSLPNQPAVRLNNGLEVRPVVEPVPAGPPRDRSIPADNPALLSPLGVDVEQLTSPQGLTASLKIMLMLTVLTLAPSILIMTTCFIRFVIVLGLLRQALGTQQLPPNQVIVSLCLFLTLMVMAPVWQESYDQGIKPYTQPQEGQPILTETEAFTRTVLPIRRFLIDQIDRADNGDAIWMFLDFQRPDPDSPAGRNYIEPQTYEDVSLTILIPAYMLSELKTAFVIGFQIYLPFLVIDLVISALLISMGMMMLPPVLITLPIKLLMFVLIDGWFLTVGMMLESVRPMTS